MWLGFCNISTMGDLCGDIADDAGMMGDRGIQWVTAGIGE